ncbi:MULTISPECIES: hypothetical protein [Gordonia]|uniref:Uncharacterized protein n=1 Tax=Gordonia amicalis TaxID=89053 RepID=A0AAE4R6M1_9ACTN|nr:MULTISPECIES: hypothetical protein [Gordonia]ATD70987.1 hypothetical protein CNO18_12630 [Gordonia sp. 1D]MCR8900033.1 hypothetical protein [Gordonia sp. GONU]MCZ4581354.1 hypothetical protein [Gordonia amicalis]MDJ0455270.1 hypothetical protein [Gordonia amicalis]MDV6314450.1 hypothetical protein [Gordonia amicalis]
MTERREHELVEQIPAADWVDQDLLTRQMSAELLSDEIVSEETRLAAMADSDLSDSDRNAAEQLLRRRIDAMKAARASYLER